MKMSNRLGYVMASAILLCLAMVGYVSAGMSVGDGSYVRIRGASANEYREGVVAGGKGKLLFVTKGQIGHLTYIAAQDKPGVTAALLDPHGDGRLLYRNGCTLTGEITYPTVNGRTNSVPYTMYFGNPDPKRPQSLATSIIAFQVPELWPLIVDAPTPAPDGDAAATSVTPLESEVEQLTRVMEEFEAKGVHQDVVIRPYAAIGAPERRSITGRVLNVFGQVNSPIASATWAYRSAPAKSFKEAMKKGGATKTQIKAMLKERDSLDDSTIRSILEKAGGRLIPALAGLDPLKGQFVVTGTTTPLEVLFPNAASSSSAPAQHTAEDKGDSGRETPSGSTKSDAK